VPGVAFVLAVHAPVDAQDESRRALRLHIDRSVSQADLAAARPAMQVTRQLAYGENVRPWEMLLLDHPRHPLTLRYAVGAVGATVPFTAETTREIVRIDVPAGDAALEATLTKECRVEVPGIYFDFDRATLDPRSSRALAAIAALLGRYGAWRIAIEGHTDNAGTDAYNLDLSRRRAAAVKEALVREHAMAAQRLTTAGFGSSRPKESNDTIAAGLATDGSHWWAAAHPRRRAGR
jgi:outer membrane protein OmpA-like peptidoglycan-associated protein